MRKTRILLILFTVFGLSRPSFSQGGPEQLQELQVAYAEAVDKRIKPLEEREVQLRQQLSVAIERESIKARNSGDLDLVLALKTVKEGLASGKPFAGSATTLPPIVRLQAAYEKEAAAISTERARLVAGMATSYIERLGKLEQMYTRANRIDDAVAVRSVRETTERDTDFSAVKSRRPIPKGHAKRPWLSPRPGKVIAYNYAGARDKLPSFVTGIPSDLNDAVYLCTTMTFDNQGRFILAVRANGTVVGWGKESHPVLVHLPKELKGVVKLSARSNAGAALVHDGSFVFWDEEGERKPYTTASGVPLVDIGMVRWAVLAVDSEGQFYHTNGGEKLTEYKKFDGRVRSLVTHDQTAFALMENGSVMKVTGAHAEAEKLIVAHQRFRAFCLSGNRAAGILPDGRLFVEDEKSNHSGEYQVENATGFSLPSFTRRVDTVHKADHSWKILPADYHGSNSYQEKMSAGCSQVIMVEDWRFAIKVE